MIWNIRAGLGCDNEGSGQYPSHSGGVDEDWDQVTVRRVRPSIDESVTDGDGYWLVESEGSGNVMDVDGDVEVVR